MELEDKIYDEILSLSNDGDLLVEESKYDEAIEKYLKALELVPSPKNKWEAATWIYTALGDTCFINENYKEGKEYLYDAINCPDGLDNPFILMRLGQCLYEMGEIDKSKEYLLKAYMLEGVHIFEEEDDKYFNSIIDII